MLSDEICIKNIQNVSDISIKFEYPDSRIIVVTGKNGLGKTTVVKAFKLISDPQVFKNSSAINSIHKNSEVIFNLTDHATFSFRFNPKLKALDSKDVLPPTKHVVAELPIPYGERFRRFSLVSEKDSEIRANIASSTYEPAHDLIEFLKAVYSTDRYAELKVCKIGKNNFYFFIRSGDYYIREDHLSSGEYFLIQLHRLIVSGAKLIVIDEVDVALDASAQVGLFSALKPLLITYEARLIVVSHSLAFMSTIEDGGLYYLEKNDGGVDLEQRSYGYIKSDLYGFRGKDRFILTEDQVLSGFIKYLIKTKIRNFFEYEIIEVGGQPQIDAIAHKNDSHHIFGRAEQVLIVVDKDIVNQLNYSGPSKKSSSPVHDIELYLWENRKSLLCDIEHPVFLPSKRDKDTAKTFWKKIIRGGLKSPDDLYELVIQENTAETNQLIRALENHLCLR